MKDVQNRIIINIIVIAAIAVGLVFFAHDFFNESDMRYNTELEAIKTTASAPRPAAENERTYYVIYEKNSELSTSIADAYRYVLDIIKVEHEFLAIEDMEAMDYGTGDYIILTIEEWWKYEAEIDAVLDAVNKGTSLVMGYAPGHDEVFQSKMSMFGITDVGEYRLCESLVVKDDILLGMKAGDVLTEVIIEDSIYEFEVDSSVKVYLTDENDVPLYYTLDYGSGRIGVFNGENTYERYYGGVIIGILGTLNDGIIYPIVNAGVVFIDDWPGPLRGENEIISSQYGMDLDGFLRYTWWPDMLTLNSKYGIKYTGQFVLTYNDIQESPFDIGKAAFDVPMYSFGQQVVKNQGEIGLHGYNHQPLWFGEYVTNEYDGYYEPWATKEDAVEALEYAVGEWRNIFPNYKINSYVPPSNIIDKTGIEVVKEVLGEPVTISGLYIGEPPQMPSHEFEVEDGVIYFPRLTAGSFLDDEIKLQLSLGAGLFGVVSHFIHPDDVIDSDRNRGYTWAQLAVEYDSMMAYITERYPFIDFATLTDASNTMAVWDDIDYSVVYGKTSITVTTLNYEKPYAMILLSDRPIAQGDGYTFQKLGTNQYYIEVSSTKTRINYVKGD